MKDYIAKFKDKDIDSISIVFYCCDGKAGQQGNAVASVYPSFKKDGFAWDVLINNYFEINHPDLFSEMETDPEPTMHTTYFEISKANELLSKKYITELEDFVESEHLVMEISKKVFQDY
jgi:hypothetical protein